MKVFISADIEGVAGIAAWEEARKGTDNYEYFRRQMSLEAAAACRGALKAGASEVLVRDGHGSGTNIIPSLLPIGTKILRAWTGGVQGMMDGLDSSFGAVMYVGYHSAGGEDGNPLAHTKSSARVERLMFNGVLSSEYAMNSYIAGMYGVPVAFLSGDAMLCANAVKLSPGITTVATLEGVGNASISLHPETAVSLIEEKAETAIRGIMESGEKKRECAIAMPAKFEVSLRYKSHAEAHRASAYPGASKFDATTVRFESADYLSALTFLHFCV